MPETPCLESIQRHRDFKARAKEIRSIQDAEEESKHEFKAKPIPNYAELSRIGVSNPERMELCEPQSPQLESVQRHRQSLLVMKKRIEDETKEIREMANFKARPLNRRVMESSGELGVCHHFFFTSLSLSNKPHTCANIGTQDQQTTTYQDYQDITSVQQDASLET